MKIDVVSDLHVDHYVTKNLDWDSLKNSGSEVIIIAGDVSNQIDMTLFIVNEAATEYESVVFVDGNHEHYDNKRTVMGNMNYLYDNFSKNVVYLNGINKLSHVINDVGFVGGMGWYDWKCHENQGISYRTAKDAWMKYSNDFIYPKYYDAKSPQTLANIQADNMVDSVDDFQNNSTISKLIMVTHSCPRVDILGFTGSYDWDVMTPSYVNTGMEKVLEADFNKKIDYWIYGHTHDRKMIQKNHVTYVNNARGYPHENNGNWSVIQLDI